MGMARTTLRYDHNVTLMRPLSGLAPGALRPALAAARKQLAAAFADMKDDLASMQFELEVEARYAGQFHELAIPVQEADLLAPENGRLLAAFHEAHSDAYGFAQRASPVEIVHLRVTAIGVLEGQDASAERTSMPAAFTPTAARKLWLDEATGWRTAASYALAESGSVRELDGPGVVDLPTSTLLVPPGWTCSITDSGDLLLAQRAGN
jgi:N-methylhydantoinase A